MAISVTVKEALEKARENDLVPFEPSDQGKPPEHLEPLYEEALAAYLITGTLRGAAAQTGLPLYEVSKIAKTPWWREQIIERRNAERAQNDTKMTKLMNMSLEQIEDVLLYGEETAIGTKMGVEVVKTKVKARDLARLLEVLFDRRQLLRGEPTGISAEGHKLSELASKLERLGQHQRAEVIEMEPAAGRRVEDQATQVQDVTPRIIPQEGKAGLSPRRS